MPSTNDNETLSPVMWAFDCARKEIPEFDELSASFKDAYAKLILPHIDKKYGHDTNEAFRYVYNTIAMATNENALQDALSTPSDATPDKQAHKVYGHFVEYTQRASQATDTQKAAEVPSLEHT